MLFHAVEHFGLSVSSWQAGQRPARIREQTCDTRSPKVLAVCRQNGFVSVLYRVDLAGTILTVVSSHETCWLRGPWRLMTAYRAYSADVRCKVGAGAPC